MMKNIIVLKLEDKNRKLIGKEKWKNEKKIITMKKLGRKSKKTKNKVWDKVYSTIFISPLLQ